MECANMMNDFCESFSHQNIYSTEEYDLDAIPLHIVRTESFQGVPGHEDLMDSFRGLASYGETGETLVDYAGTDDFDFLSVDVPSIYINGKPQLSKSFNNGDASLDASSLPAIPKPQLSKSSNYADALAPEWTNILSIPKPRLSKQSNDVDAARCKDIFHFDKVFQEKSKVLSPSGIPEPKPFLLMRTSWTVTGLTLACIEAKINACLKNMPDASFNPTPEMCKWDMWVTQCQGTGSCKMQVAIYSTDAQGVYIVECNRLSGDHGPFNEAYRCIKAAFAMSLEHPTLKRQSTIRDSFASNMGPIPCHEWLPDEDAKKALLPIMNYALSEIVDDQIEASRMLCDFSNDETLQQILCDAKTLRVILHLAQDQSPVLARQNALVALANLTTQHGPCQESIIAAGVVPVLLQLVCNGSYETAELRRESARALANLSCRLASHVRKEIGEEHLKTWFSSVDTLADERVKLHALAARDSLRLVCV